MPIELPRGLPFAVDTWTRRRRSSATASSPTRTATTSPASPPPAPSPPRPRSTPPASPPSSPSASSRSSTAPRSSSSRSATRRCASPTPTATSPSPPSTPITAQVINCIWKHPNAPMLYLVCDMLGQEDVLIEVSKAFGSKIFVDTEKNADCHQTLTHVAPEILADTSAESSTRFHVIPFPRLSERATEIFALARAKQQPEPLIIRPSAQWYNYYEPADGSTQQKALLTEPMRDEFGVWHVCLSMHSSREELEQALGILKPKWVVSTTPPCMAVDLSYVKKHCSLSRFGPDDPLWKLLGISDGMSTTVTVSHRSNCRY